jgi:hypothetical protein
MFYSYRVFAPMTYVLFLSCLCTNDILSPIPIVSLHQWHFKSYSYRVFAPMTYVLFLSCLCTNDIIMSYSYRVFAPMAYVLFLSCLCTNDICLIPIVSLHQWHMSYSYRVFAPMTYVLPSTLLLQQLCFHSRWATKSSRLSATTPRCTRSRPPILTTSSRVPASWLEAILLGMQSALTVQYCCFHDSRNPPSWSRKMLQMHKKGVWIGFSWHSPNWRVVPNYYSPSQETTGPKYRKGQL